MQSPRLANDDPQSRYDRCHPVPDAFRVVVPLRPHGIRDEPASLWVGTCMASRNGWRSESTDREFSLQIATFAYADKSAPGESEMVAICCPYLELAGM